MAENEVELTLEELESLWDVNDVAEHFEVSKSVVRREARKNKIPGAVEVLGRHGFLPDEVLEWEPPEPGTRRVGARRDDGRRPYKVYWTDEEYESVKDQYEIIDPREKRKARKAAKKAEKAEAEDESESEQDEANPFEDFGA